MPRPKSPWTLVSIQVVAPACLHLKFMDGTEGEVDMGPFLASPRMDGTVFEALRDPKVFNAVTIFLGAPQWPNGADLAPDALHDDLQGKPRFVMPAE